MYNGVCLLVRRKKSSVSIRRKNEKKIRFWMVRTLNYFLMQMHLLQEVSLASTELHLMCETEHSLHTLQNKRKENVTCLQP